MYLKAIFPVVTLYFFLLSHASFDAIGREARIHPCTFASPVEFFESYHRNVHRAILTTESKRNEVKSLWLRFLPQAGIKQELYQENFPQQTESPLQEKYFLWIDSYSFSEDLDYVQATIKLQVGNQIAEEQLTIPAPLLLNLSEERRTQGEFHKAATSFSFTDEAGIRRDIALGFFVKTVSRVPQLELFLASSFVFLGDDQIAGEDFALPYRDVYTWGAGAQDAQESRYSHTLACQGTLDNFWTGLLLATDAELQD